jgi:hypothetical protein
LTIAKLEDAVSALALALVTERGRVLDLAKSVEARQLPANTVNSVNSFSRRNLAKKLDEARLPGHGLRLSQRAAGLPACPHARSVW